MNVAMSSGAIGIQHSGFGSFAMYEEAHIFFSALRFTSLAQELILANFADPRDAHKYAIVILRNVRSSGSRKPSSPRK